jgi:ribosomal protein L29
MKELNACTVEELEQALAHARKELLNDTEVKEFWQVYQEIQLRRATAA